MRIRCDAAFIASVLFTIVLLYMVPICWSNALTGSDRKALEALDPGDPRPVLGATFNSALRTPARLMRQLDVSARISADAKLLRLRLTRDADPHAAAAVVMEWLR